MCGRSSPGCWGGSEVVLDERPGCCLSCLRVRLVDSPRRALSTFPPAESQLSDAFGIVAAKGETSDLFFGVYASRDVKFTVEAPRGFPGRVSVCRAHEWLRKDAGGVTRMPEVLFPVEGPVTLPAGRSALMMLQVRVPEDAESGHYAGRLRLVAGGAAQEAEVALDVLPFPLRWPSPRKHESILHGGPLDDETPDRMIGLAKEMKARGFESMLVPCQYGRGMLVLGKGADGRLRIESFRRLDNAIAAYRAAGMTGTFFVHFSDKLEAAVARALGVGLKDGHGEQTNAWVKQSSSLRRMKRAWYLQRTNMANVDVVLSFNLTVAGIAAISEEAHPVYRLLKSTAGTTWTVVDVEPVATSKGFSFTIRSTDCADGFYTLGAEVSSIGGVIVFR